MGEQPHKIYQTNESNVDVEAPLEARTVGNNVITQDNIVRDEYFSNKMLDIQQTWLESQLQKVSPERPYAPQRNVVMSRPSTKLP